MHYALCTMRFALCTLHFAHAPCTCTLHFAPWTLHLDIAHSTHTHQSAHATWGELFLMMHFRQKCVLFLISPRWQLCLECCFEALSSSSSLGACNNGHGNHRPLHITALLPTCVFHIFKQSIDVQTEMQTQFWTPVKHNCNSEYISTLNANVKPQHVLNI